MTQRSKTIISVCGIVLMVALVWWKLITNGNFQGNHSEVVNKFKNSTTSPPPVVALNVRPIATRPPAIDRTRAEMEWRREWQTPIVFFGKVLDEKNLPVVGAKVTDGPISVNAMTGQEGDVRGDVYSDAQGLFVISGIKSRAMGVQLSHPDYYTSRKNRNLISYEGGVNPNAPDTPAKAWIYRMYKKRASADLVRGQAGLHGTMDGTPFILNLGKFGKVIAEGMRAKPQPWDGKPFDWQVRLSVPDGGIAPCTDEVSFEAPTDGYTPDIKVIMSKEDKNWKTDIRKSYYIRTANVFGRIDVSISSYHDLFFAIQYRFNPTGSNNLEGGFGTLVPTPQ